MRLAARAFGTRAFGTRAFGTRALAAGAVAAALAVPATAPAQTAGPICQEMIDRVAARIPDLSESPTAHERLNLTREQLQAALASLDAARLISDTDTGGCLTMVNAARTVIARGQAAMPEGATAIADLQAWTYQPLYENAWRASLLMAAPVRNQQGEEVGDIEDILLHPDGTLTAAVVEVGGFLDIGDQPVRVPWEQVSLGRDDGRVVATAPVSAETAGDFSLFEEEIDVAQDEIRMTSLINETVRLKTGEPYGYIFDVLVEEGKVRATVMRPDIAYAGRKNPFSVPYYAYEYGYSPGYDFYLLPYDREQLERLEGFDVGKVKGVDGQEATQ